MMKKLLIATCVILALTVGSLSIASAGIVNPYVTVTPRAAIAPAPVVCVPVGPPVQPVVPVPVTAAWPPPFYFGIGATYRIDYHVHYDSWWWPF